MLSHSPMGQSWKMRTWDLTANQYVLRAEYLTYALNWVNGLMDIRAWDNFLNIPISGILEPCYVFLPISALPLLWLGETFILVSVTWCLPHSPLLIAGSPLSSSVPSTSMLPTLSPKLPYQWATPRKWKLSPTQNPGTEALPSIFPMPTYLFHLLYLAHL